MEPWEHRVYVPNPRWMDWVPGAGGKPDFPHPLQGKPRYQPSPPWLQRPLCSVIYSLLRLHLSSLLPFSSALSSWLINIFRSLTSPKPQAPPTPANIPCSSLASTLFFGKRTVRGALHTADGNENRSNLLEDNVAPCIKNLKNVNIL